MAVQVTSLIAPSSPAAGHRSPWHSPVPYLFGGLAAMLGLIAFALLILACSVWKISGDHDPDLEAGTGDGDGDGDFKPENNTTPPFVYEEKYLVIMAGESKPTFLATPISSRASSFDNCNCRSSTATSTSEMEMTGNVKEGSDDRIS